MSNPEDEAREKVSPNIEGLLQGSAGNQKTEMKKVTPYILFILKSTSQIERNFKREKIRYQLNERVFNQRMIP